MRKLIVLLFLFCCTYTGLLAETANQTEPQTETTKVKASIISPSKTKDGIGQIVVEYFFPKGMHQTFQEDYFFVNVTPVEGIEFGETIYPDGPKDENGLTEYHGKTIVIKPFSIKSDSFNNTIIKVTAGYQVCFDSGTCQYPEEMEFDLPFSYNRLDKNKEAGSEKGSAMSDILKYLLMAFIGGLILNIMPCVLPVLSIKAMHLVGQSNHDKKEIMKGSFAYTGGILVSFLIMSLVVIAIKITGESVGWGFQFQNIGFVMVLAGIMFVFSLSLFDVFIISPPGMSVATKASSKQGHSGSFVSGIFAVLLATPCTAPFLGAALGFAFSQPPLLILIFFQLIGLGLAFPFIMLAFWPKVIQKLPKPGEWMNVFKEFMGFLLLGTTIFLLNTARLLVGNGTNFMKILWFMLALGMASWIYGRFAKPQHSRKQQWISLFLAIALIIGSGILLLKFENTESVSIIDEGWQKFSPELVQKYKDENKPVFVDFGAEWCLTCKTVEKTVLNTDDMQAEFKKYKVELIKGDNTKKDEIIMQWLKKFNRAGVPLYLLYYPGVENPVVFPETPTKGMIIDALKKLDK